MTEAAEIAAKLTKAQRSLIQRAMPIESHTGKTLWRIPASPTHYQQAAFAKLGVAVLNILTRTGEAVRAVLQEKG